MLDKIKTVTKRYVYARMTPQQFSEALDHVKMTKREFAKVFGTKIERVQSWLDGQEDIPHNAALVLGLLTLPGAKDLAWAYTDTVATDRRSLAGEGGSDG